MRRIGYGLCVLAGIPAYVAFMGCVLAAAALVHGLKWMVALPRLAPVWVMKRVAHSR